jgi:isopentenyldiphosphate isomerase
MDADIVIVDSDDNVLGYKPRKTVDYENDIYRSTSLWLENSKGEVLIAKRSQTKDKDPGLWSGAAGGTVDKGETYDTNIYKEVEEEIGLTGVEFKFVAKIWNDVRRKHFIQIYTAVVDKQSQDFKLQIEEVDEVKWISKSELAKEVKNSPEKYGALMPKLIEIFI